MSTSEHANAHKHTVHKQSTHTGTPSQTHALLMFCWEKKYPKRCKYISQCHNCYTHPVAISIRKCFEYAIMMCHNIFYVPTGQLDRTPSGTRWEFILYPIRWRSVWITLFMACFISPKEVSDPGTCLEDFPPKVDREVS